MLQMMDAFSEFECALINERQREGIAAARKPDQPFGRKKALTNDQIDENSSRVADGATKSSLPVVYSISLTALY